MRVRSIAAMTASHPTRDGAVDFLGAVRTVTGAMTRVTLGGGSVLVDCGVAQGDEARRWRMPNEAHRVDAVVLTHGHNDHVGSLPDLLDGGYAGPIFGTPATLEIARLVLVDGLRLQGASDAAVETFLGRFRSLSRPVPYRQTFAPIDKNGQVRARFHDAGHILGSASVELLSEKSRVIVSGDLGRPGSPILPDYNATWDPGPPIDVVVLECTYGNRNHRHGWRDVESELARVLIRAVADRGHILVPAFAIGRTQALLYHLNNLVESGRLPNLPVAVDAPLGLRITELYQRSRHLYDHEATAKLAAGDDPLDFAGLYAVRRASDSIRLRDVKEPMLIIAGSGMCTGGRIIGHLQELLPRPETLVLFVGYQAPGTPGHQIQNARRGDTIFLGNQPVTTLASRETIEGLSAHADRQELLRWVRSLPEIRRLALHHGDPTSQESFRDWAARELGAVAAM
jgi:metallo-beta-lactamase family protein